MALTNREKDHANPQRNISSILYLSGGYSYSELFTDAGLARLDGDFLRYLGEQDGGLRDGLLAYRRGTEV
ncbi:MAG: hypothetical protein ACYDCX_00965, partial [Acidithiobacillus sp.]